jgi:hypothetical protein
VYRILVVRSEGKISLGRPRRRLEDNIKTQIQEVVCVGEGMDCIDLAENTERSRALVNAVMNLRVP